MSITIRRWMLPTIAVAALALLALAVLRPAPTAASPNTPQLIKLYEGGKVAAQWTSEGEGRMDGDSFVFTVRKGVTSGTVRIRGTFTAEPVP
jgi:hypothetical protein